MSCQAKSPWSGVADFLPGFESQQRGVRPDTVSLSRAHERPARSLILRRRYANSPALVFLRILAPPVVVRHVHCLLARGAIFGQVAACGYGTVPGLWVAAG